MDVTRRTFFGVVGAALVVASLPFSPRLRLPPGTIVSRHPDGRLVPCNDMREMVGVIGPDGGLVTHGRVRVLVRT